MKNTVTIRQFAENYNMKPQTVNTYIKRGKLISCSKTVNGKEIKAIDINNDINKYFIAKLISYGKQSKNKQPTQQKPKSKKIVKKEPIKKSSFSISLK